MKKLKQMTEANFKLPYIYIGKVVAVDDIKKRNRVRCRIIGINPDEILDNECPWVEQASTIFSGNDEVVGVSSVPCVGSYVYIQFLYGDPSHPVYTGVVRGNEDSSELQKIKDLSNTIYETRNSNKIGPELDPLNDKSVYPHNNVIETPKGNIIEMDDTDGNERIAIEHKLGSFVEIRPDGTVQIKSIKDFYNIVKGMVEEYIEGDMNQVIKGKLTEEIDSDKSTTVKGKETKNIISSYTVTASNIFLN